MKSSHSDDEDVGHSHATRPRPRHRPLLARHGGLARPQAGAAAERPAGPDGRRSEATILLTEPVYLPVTLRARVLAGDTTPGTTYTVPVFNPFALRDEPLTVKVDGRAALDGVDAIVLTEEQHDLRARVWLTPDGSVLREEGSLGLTLVRESREAALAGDAALVPLDLVSASRIPVAGRIDDPRHVRRLTLRMQGAAAARVPLDPPRQRVRGDLLRVEREPL